MSHPYRTPGEAPPPPDPPAPDGYYHGVVQLVILLAVGLVPVAAALWRDGWSFDASLGMLLAIFAAWQLAGC